MRALIGIDIQNDFCPGGTLAVHDGDAIVPFVNAQFAQSECVILSQDWHPTGHSSFASTHDQAPFSAIDMPYGSQVLWPDHCVAGTKGAAFHPDLNTDAARLVVRKGHNPSVDSYSAFFENDRKTITGLHGALQELGVNELLIMGLATDYCVAYSALDAAQLGYEVCVDLRGCRAIDVEGSRDAALMQLRDAGVKIEC